MDRTILQCMYFVRLSVKGWTNQSLMDILPGAETRIQEYYIIPGWFYSQCTLKGNGLI